jgi:hypothetical protein
MSWPEASVWIAFWLSCAACVVGFLWAVTRR